MMKETVKMTEEEEREKICDHEINYTASAMVSGSETRDSTDTEVENVEMNTADIDCIWCDETDYQAIARDWRRIDDGEVFK